MKETLTFLHTSPVHIATFDRLIAEADVDIPVKHVEDESLPGDARVSGMSPDLTRRITHTIADAIDGGAAVVLYLSQNWVDLRKKLYISCSASVIPFSQSDSALSMTP